VEALGEDDTFVEPEELPFETRTLME